LPLDFIDELDRVGKRKGYSTVARSVYKSLSSYVAARALYSTIKMPVTLVYGDHDWSLSTERRAAAAKIKGAYLITLPRTGHFLSLEAPDEFARILIDTKSQFEAAPNSLMWTVPGWQGPFLGCGD
jgi:pimeloyl-ACP methyl ester carboxylesterase